MKNVVYWDIETHIMSPLKSPVSLCYVSFEVCTSVTLKNVVFWDKTNSVRISRDRLRLRYRVQPVNVM
jgi:hypothetical protein